MTHEIPEEPCHDLLERARGGDDDAVGELYRRYGGRVYTLALRMLTVREAAEDVLQDVFVALPGALRQFRGDAPFWAWLRRVAVTRALMRIRAERARPRLVSWNRGADGEPLEWPDEAADGAADRALLARDLESALAALAPVSRAVVWLHDVEGWTHQEIAAAMGRSVSFSKSQLARAHQRLRGLLEAGHDRIEESERHASESGRVAGPA
jgi:RNA polymerase sigma factor (sigma-70 family)